MDNAVTVVTDETPIGPENEFVGVVARGTPAPADVSKLVLLLIRPSKYDDEGYVIRFVRGVLPSNTLATLAGLTEEVIDRRELGDAAVEVVLMDEVVQRIEPARLAKKYCRPGTRVVAALCGVQSNQFPRAADLALRFKAAGIPAMIGGFHVSGSIALCEGTMPPELQALLDEGITLVKGEVEDCWGDLLRDALHGRLRTLYDILVKPDLTDAGVPVVDPRLMKRYAYPFMGTIDAGRGCPFGCSFCTIINVQGRKMRCRSATRILDRIRRNTALKIDYYFFTDDNFARNPNWREILDGMIALRAEGIKFQFLIQVDVLAYRIPEFMEKVAAAGCSQVFIGMESINPANLADSGKRQNKVEDFRTMIDAWHAHKVPCHVGYIIGFPHDTPESVREDVRRLRDEMGVDQAAFFMLTPLPGSQDHANMKRRGDWMDPDYNKFDSFHVTANHPRMSAEEWTETYRRAWRAFYTTDTMKSVMARTSDTLYWGLLKDFVWYKYAFFVEETHPMICGFFRLRDRTDRRPGCAIDPWWTHARRRFGEIRRVLRGCVSLYFEMQEVWLATRGRDQFQANLDEIKRRAHDVRERVGETTRSAGQAISRGVSSVAQGAGEALHRAQAAGRHAADDLSQRFDQLAAQHGPRLAPLRRAAARLNPFAIKLQTREHLNDYWKQTYGKLRRGRIFQINPFKLTVNFLRDAKLCTIFSVHFFSGYGK